MELGPVKRSDALKALRQHHQALVVVTRLKRASAGAGSEAREAFLDFPASEGQGPFRVSEEVLLPAFAGHTPPTTRPSSACSSSTWTCGGGAPSLLGTAIRRPRRCVSLASASRATFATRSGSSSLIEEALPEDELERLVGVLKEAGARG